MNKYDIAQDYINKGNYKQAFFLLKELTQDASSLKFDRSDAFNLLGILVSSYDLDLNEYDDESGLTYYKKSLELNPKNIGALCNIVNSYGDQSFQHKDVKTFVTAYKALQELINENSSLRKELEVELLAKKDKYVRAKNFFN